MSHPRVIHRELGEGVVTSFGYDIDDLLLAFVRWTTNESNGIAGGWYDLVNPSIKVLDAVALKRLFDAFKKGER